MEVQSSMRTAETRIMLEAPPFVASLFLGERDQELL